MTHYTIALALIAALQKEVSLLELELSQQTAQTEHITPLTGNGNLTGYDLYPVQTSTPIEASTTYSGNWVCYSPRTGDSIQVSQPYECPSGIPMTMQDYISKFVN